MNVRKIREDLGKARTCVQRRDLSRAVYLLCIALRDIGSQSPPMDLRSDIRTTVSDICSDPAYKKEGATPVSYQAGKERDLLVHFNKFYKALMGAEDQEDYETTMQRKLNLDRAFNNGKSFLSQGKYSEADDCFTEAFKYYKNEIAIYGMMAKAMMDAGQYVRALGYLKKGLAVAPDNASFKALAEECLKLRQQK